MQCTPQEIEEKRRRAQLKLSAKLRQNGFKSTPPPMKFPANSTAKLNPSNLPNSTSSNLPNSTPFNLPNSTPLNSPNSTLLNVPKSTLPNSTPNYVVTPKYNNSATKSISSTTTKFINTPGGIVPSGSTTSNGNSTNNYSSAFNRTSVFNNTPSVFGVKLLSDKKSFENVKTGQNVGISRNASSFNTHNGQDFKRSFGQTKPYENKGTGQMNSPMVKTKEQFYGNKTVITGECYLTCEDRFAVELSGYSNVAIDVFKTIPSKNYSELLLLIYTLFQNLIKILIVLIILLCHYILYQFTPKRFTL